MLRTLRSWNTRHTSEIPNLWGDLRDTAPKVDEQLEKDIEALRAITAPPIPQREFVMHSTSLGGDLYRDITPSESPLAPLARTILHLLKR